MVRGDIPDDPSGARRTGGVVGVSVLLLRPREEGEGGEEVDSLARLLQDGGLSVVHLPLTASQPPRDARPLERGLQRWRAGEFDVLLLTSPRSAEVVGDLLPAASGASPLPVPGEIWAVGPATARAAEGAGLRVDRIPSRFVAEGLLEEAPTWRALKGLRIFFPRAEEGRERLPEGLSQEGAFVTLVAAYRNAPVPRAAEDAAARLLRGEFDLVVLTAGSQARELARAWHAASPGAAWPPRARVVVIGSATEAAARAVGIPVARVADPHTLEGVAEAVFALVGAA